MTLWNSRHKNNIYALIAIFTAILIFIPMIHCWLMRKLPLYEQVLVVMDTLGLGIFTVVGIRIAFDVSNTFSGFLLIFVGVVTGVGGGIIRDVLAGDTPYIFVKHIYASASLIGAVVCVVLWHLLASM